jgi:anti-sigma factor RsiW
MMFDFIRNLTKSEAIKRQEMITAYLDSALSPADQRRFEQLLVGDPVLRASVDQQRLIKQQLRQLPRVPAPRNFTLDPALYGRSRPQTSARLYPYARFATAMAGILLVVLLATDLVLLSSRSSQTPATEPLASDTQMLSADEAVAGEVMKEVTRVVTEEVGAEVEMAAEAVTEEEVAVEAMPEAPAEEMPAAAGATDLLPMVTQPASDEPLPYPVPSGTADAFESSRQAEATPAASAAGQPITSTFIQGAETETLGTSPPTLEDDSVGGEPVNVLRLVEIALLVVVIVLVGLTLYLRRLP